MLDTEIDELTKSIKEVVTGRSYETLITPATIEDLHATSATWQFDWNLELANGDVFKLTVPKLGQHIHGLISLAYGEGYVWINVIESHPENVGRRKKYSGVAANLVAYACKLSFERGLEGFVSFDAKSTLIEHYKRSLGATQIGRSQRMYLDRIPSQRLVDQYFGEKHAGQKPTRL